MSSLRSSIQRAFLRVLPRCSTNASWYGRKRGEIDVGVSGTLRRTSPIWPTVGDWVVLREDADVIVKVLERKTKLCRKQPDREIREQVLAANVDVLFIVSGLDRDYNERRLERYLVVAKQSGARPVVLLNKSDLADGNGMDIAEVVKKDAADGSRSAGGGTERTV